MLRLAAARRIAVGRSRSDEAPAQPLNRARRRDSAANLRTRGNEHPITGWLIGAAALGARAGPGLLGAAGGAASPTPAGHEFMPANKKRRKYPRYTRPRQGGGVRVFSRTLLAPRAVCEARTVFSSWADTVGGMRLLEIGNRRDVLCWRTGAGQAHFESIAW